MSNPIDVACPSCKVKSGSPCSLRGGSYSLIRGVRMHQSRIDAEQALAAVAEGQVQAAAAVGQVQAPAEQAPVFVVAGGRVLPVGPAGNAHYDIPINVVTSDKTIGHDAAEIAKGLKKPSQIL
jgi:hypothetical protein